MSKEQIKIIKVANITNYRAIVFMDKLLLAKFVGLAQK